MNANDIIEECAETAEAEEDNGPDAPFDNGGTRDGWRMACAKIAEQIRALKSSPDLKVGDANAVLPELDKSSPGVTAGAISYSWCKFLCNHS